MEEPAHFTGGFCVPAGTRSAMVADISAAPRYLFWVSNDLVAVVVELGHYAPRHLLQEHLACVLQNNSCPTRVRRVIRIPPLCEAVEIREEGDTPPVGLHLNSLLHCKKMRKEKE